MLKCTQSNCQEEVMYSYYWMSEKKYACKEHAQAAKNIGAALGLPVTLTLIYCNEEEWI